MLQCPRCNRQLLRTKNEHGIFFRCDDCDGRMVALPVLRRSKAHEAIVALWIAAREQTTTGSKTCPFCRKPMVEVHAGEDAPTLLLDVCRGCQFVWFDPAEFDQTPDLPAAESKPSPMPRKAREQLAMIEVKRIGREADPAPAGPDHWWQMVPAMFGMPVEHGVGKAANRPWVTWLTAAVVIICGIMAMMDLKGAVKSFGLIPAQLGRMGGLTLLTSFFLHGGWVHLIGNVYFLLIFGDNTEDVLGPIQYALLLFSATLIGGLLHTATNAGSTVPCIGASGGIAGVMVFYLLRFPHARLGVFIIFRIYARIPALLYLAFWIGMQILGSLTASDDGGGVAYMAHLGGALTGCLFFFSGRLARRRYARA